MKITTFGNIRIEDAVKTCRSDIRDEREREKIRGEDDVGRDLRCVRLRGLQKTDRQFRDL